MSTITYIGRIGGRLALPVHPGALRLWLAMLVFVVHLSSLALGAFAVDVFFLLSGLWIQRMWEARYRYARAPYLTYLVSRTWRLAPVMLLATAAAIPLLLALGVPVARVFAAPAHLFASTLLLFGYAWLGYMPVGSAWSLDVEMQFYLVAPLLALAVSRSGGAVALLVLAACVSAITASWMIPPALPRYLIFFVVGMVAARFAWRPSARAATWSAGVVAASIVIVGVSPWRPLLIGGAHPLPLHRYNELFNAALALLAAPFAVWTTYQRTDADDRMMGDLSYLVYLFHWLGMQWFFTVQGSFAQRLPAAALCMVIVPALSWLVWRYYDRPINRARARWVASRIVQDDPASAPMPGAGNAR